MMQKISIIEIAKKCRFTPGTILKHIEDIFAIDPKFDIAYLKPQQERFEKIAFAFGKSGGFALTSVHDILGDDYSYDELRLSRIFIKRL